MPPTFVFVNERASLHIVHAHKAIKATAGNVLSVRGLFKNTSATQQSDNQLSPETSTTIDNRNVRRRR